jgi:DNA-directed RNA polymerase specialized sigma24 family protein
VDDDRHPGCTDDHPHADFTVFVKAHLNGFLLPVARRYAGFRGIPDAAPDIAQEALARVWCRWNTELASEPCGRRLASVCTTMSYVAREQRRERFRAGEVTDPWEFPEPCGPPACVEDQSLAREMLQDVVRALATLSEDDRLIIDLAIARVPHAEIAVQAQLRAATNVSTKLHRIRARLARSVDPGLRRELETRPGLDDPSGGVA